MRDGDAAEGDPMNRKRLLLLMGLLNTIRRQREAAEKQSLALKVNEAFDATLGKDFENVVRRMMKEGIR
jgi:hypothetical protein